MNEEFYVGYQPKAKFGTWLFHISKNVARNALRSRRRHPCVRLSALRMEGPDAPGERVLVIEDVTTTGGSVREVMQVAQERQGQVVGVGAILNRSPGQIDLGVPLHTLALLQLQNYQPEVCPLCQQGSQAVKPGSRQLPGGSR